MNHGIEPGIFSGVVSRRERIETERLVLRRPVASDAEAILGCYAGDPDVTRYLGWATHHTVDDTRAFLEFSDREWSRWPAGPYVVSSRATGELLGGTGLVFESPQRAVTG
jgi:RimJ/RimL family protein N-acetyltransferase